MKQRKTQKAEVRERIGEVGKIRSRGGGAEVQGSKGLLVGFRKQKSAGHCRN